MSNWRRMMGCPWQLAQDIERSVRDTCRRGAEVVTRGERHENVVPEREPGELTPGERKSCEVSP